MSKLEWTVCILESEPGIRARDLKVIRLIRGEFRVLARYLSTQGWTRRPELPGWVDPAIG